jgi:PncC family amidohydrolase
MDALHHRDPAPRQLADLPDLLHGRRVACAESCTAGRVAAELAAVGDAADWLIGSIVAYQTAVKRQLLGVRAAVVVTGQAAEEMATGVASLLGGEVAIATTGVLGDDPVDGVAPGTVHVATVVDGEIRTRELHVGGEPETRCRQAAEAACRQLVDHLSMRASGTGAVGGGAGAEADEPPVR